MTTPTAGRPRRPDTDARIRTATLELLRTHGPEAVNIASVAARSGVARTTIYRRHSDRRALLAAALGPATQRGAAPADLDVSGRLIWVLTAVATVLDDEVGPGGVAAVLTGSDPEFSSVLRNALEDGLRPVADQIIEDLRSGALPVPIPPDVVINLLVGSHLSESLRHGTPDDEWRHRTVTALATLLGVTP